MADNSTKKTLAWLGLGCSCLTALGLLCPICVVLGAAVDFIDASSTWQTDDFIYSTFFLVIVVVGVLFILGVGGFSLYYLIKGSKEE